ncbi:hypothetical protein S83_037808, partial [Arachis hypogaea]
KAYFSILNINYTVGGFVFQGKLRIGVAEQTLLAALGQAAVQSEEHSKPPAGIKSPLEEKAKYMDKPHEGKHSTKGLGKNEPNESEHVKWRGDVTPMPSNIKTSELMYNEYIVYNTSQVRFMIGSAVIVTNPLRFLASRSSKSTALSLCCRSVVALTFYVAPASWICHCCAGVLVLPPLGRPSRSAVFPPSSPKIQKQNPNYPEPRPTRTRPENPPSTHLSSFEPPFPSRCNTTPAMVVLQASRRALSPVTTAVIAGCCRDTTPCLNVNFRHLSSVLEPLLHSCFHRRINGGGLIIQDCFSALPSSVAAISCANLFSSLGVQVNPNLLYSPANCRMSNNIGSMSPTLLFDFKFCTR